MKYIKSFESKFRDVVIAKTPELIKLANIKYQDDEQLIYCAYPKI